VEFTDEWWQRRKSQLLALLDAGGAGAPEPLIEVNQAGACEDGKASQ